MKILHYSVLLLGLSLLPGICLRAQRAGFVTGVGAIIRGKVLDKEISLEDARAAIQQATRRYAKRQMTWFRKEEGMHWMNGFGDDPKVRRKVLERIQEGLEAEMPGGTGMDV